MAAVTLADSRSSILTDPLRNFKFQVNINKGDIPGIVRLGFMSVDGLVVNTDMIPYREGGNNTTARKLPGQTNFSPIQCARGMVVGTPQGWQWFQQIFAVIAGGGNALAGTDFRTTVTVLLLDHPVTAGPVPVKAQWTIFNAWPTTLQYSTLDAGGNGIEVEQMTLENEGWTLDWAAATPGSSV